MRMLVARVWCLNVLLLLEFMLPCLKKINLSPVSELSSLDIWQDAQAMSDATADERLTAGMQVFLECLTKSGSKVEKLDKKSD